MTTWEGPEPFEHLVREAEERPFRGWDFSYLSRRMTTGALPWDYARIVRSKLPRLSSLLDLGTGGGELLASLSPLPRLTCATESYPPNVKVASRRLRRLGVAVVAAEPAPDDHPPRSGAPGDGLPFRDESFQLVIDRGESFDPREIFRVLRAGGTFVTEQVGGRHLADLNELLHAPRRPSAGWDVDAASRQLRAAGLRITRRAEAFPSVTFTDVGAVVYYLRAVPWQVPDFRVSSYRHRLEEVHRRIESSGKLVLGGHRFYLEAERP